MQWFFYGTLLDPDIRRWVMPHVADALRFRPARLSGYRRVRAKNAHYPVLDKCATACVDGLIAEGLDERAVLRSAHFEGHEYEPRRILVATAGRRREAAYVFMPRHGGFATKEPWDFYRWERQRKRRIMPQVAFWMSQPGVEHLSSPELLWHTRRMIRAIAAESAGSGRDELPAEDYRLAA